jgi:hypothetical protein
MLVPQTFAVLMGDIVGSERAQSIPRTHRTFNSAVAWANEKHGSVLASPLTITLGDEFQGLVTRLESAWRVATDLRFKLMQGSIACRFVIGLVSIETAVNPDRAWNMMGPGLAAARDKLNDKSSSNAHRFSIPGNRALEVLADAVGETLTRIENGWTDTQRRYLLQNRLLNKNAASIAKSANVSLRAVYKVLHAAQLDYHDRQSAALLAALAAQDESQGLR